MTPPATRYCVFGRLVGWSAGRLVRWLTLLMWALSLKWIGALVHRVCVFSDDELRGRASAAGRCVGQHHHVDVLDDLVFVVLDVPVLLVPSV